MRIEECGGIEGVLATGFIPTLLTSREVEILGIVIDANDKFEARWTRLQSLCRSALPDLPGELPVNGLIAIGPEEKKLGVWIMPDNRSRGMLETFMGFLVPEPQEPIWQRAQSAVRGAIDAGAACRAAHVDRAAIYTWLAWQDPPGQSLGTALLQHALDSHAAYAEPFIQWFCNLFELSRLPAQAA